jgi:2-keto-3-deoxy-L-rhamnonate aldolase RhmA
MLRTNSIKQALKQGKPITGTMISEVGSPGVVWIMANAGFDFVFIDMEHGAFDIAQVGDMLKVARLAGIVPLVRIPDLSYHWAARVLDAGAMGIMLPRVETREQAEQLVSFMKYPPVGVRGATTGRGHTDYGGARPQELVRHMNENTVVVLQIERERAVENIDELLSVPGVDAAVIGPLDLAVSLGEDSMVAPRVEEAIQKVVDAAKRHNVASGIHIADLDVVLKWHKRGMTVLACDTDMGYMMSGAAKTAAALKAASGVSATAAEPAEVTV